MSDETGPISELNEGDFRFLGTKKKGPKGSFYKEPQISIRRTCLSCTDPVADTLGEKVAVAYNAVQRIVAVYTGPPADTAAFSIWAPLKGQGKRLSGTVSLRLIDAGCPIGRSVKGWQKDQVWYF